MIKTILLSGDNFESNTRNFIMVKSIFNVDILTITYNTFDYLRYNHTTGPTQIWIHIFSSCTWSLHLF